MTDLRVVAALTGKEVRDALRNRWFLLYTIAFTLLAGGSANAAAANAHLTGGGGFGRSAAVLVNLVLFFVPLMGLTLGAAALVGERERGTLATLLAQPITRTDVFVSKLIGLSLSMFAALAIGFGVSSAIIARRGGGDAGVLLTLVGATAALAVVSLALGLLISACSSKGPAAIGAALFVWVAIILLTDLGLMAGATMFKLRAPTLFGLAVVNPLQAFKILVIAATTGSLDILGPAGVYAQRAFGASLPFVLLGSLLAWALTPLTIGAVVFGKRAAT